MDMLEWAKKEVELVKNREKEDSGYYTSCCDSALRAFEQLCNDGHSGMSISITKNILNKLIDGIPLTPIEDTEDAFDSEGYPGYNEEYMSHQCIRRSALFKHVYKDGTVKYSDVDRIVCVNLKNPNVTYSSSTVRDIIDELYPITMPYIFKGYIKVYCEDFLTDEKNGDYDTEGILYAILPNGEKKYINRFIHYINGKIPVDIDAATYNRLKESRVNKEV